MDVSLSSLPIFYISVLQHKYLSRIESTLGRYKAMVKGYDFAGVTDLYRENQRINEQNKVSDTL